MIVRYNLNTLSIVFHWVYPSNEPSEQKLNLTAEKTRGRNYRLAFSVLVCHGTFLSFQKYALQEAWSDRQEI